MTPDEIIDELLHAQSCIPHEALEAASLHRDVLTNRFLGILFEVIARPEMLQDDPDFELPFYAMYLLAAWRERRAHPLILGFLRLPGDLPVEISGDIVTQDMDRILAQTCGGDPSGIVSLASDDHVNEWSRGAAIGALSLLARWGEVPREVVIEQYRRWLLPAESSRDPEAFDMPTEVASGAMDLQAVELREEILHLFDRGWIDDSIVGERKEVIAGLEHASPYPPNGPIDDVAHAIRWWGCFEDERQDLVPPGGYDPGAMEPVRPPAIDPSIPYRAPPKISRNAPCPCGSGKKYKKCCGF